MNGETRKLVYKIWCDTVVSQTIDCNSTVCEQGNENAVLLMTIGIEIEFFDVAVTTDRAS